MLTVVSGGNSVGVYKSYFTIEDLEKVDVVLGKDRITDQTLASSLIATNVAISAKVGNSDVLTINDNGIDLESGKTIRYNANTLL